MMLEATAVVLPFAKDRLDESKAKCPDEIDVRAWTGIGQALKRVLAKEEKRWLR